MAYPFMVVVSEKKMGIDGKIHSYYKAKPFKSLTKAKKYAKEEWIPPGRVYILAGRDVY